MTTRDEPCPQRHRHTRCPEGYLDWHAWAERKARTHAQQQCPGCGRWAIWRKRRSDDCNPV